MPRGSKEQNRSADLIGIATKVARLDDPHNSRSNLFTSDRYHLDYRRHGNAILAGGGLRDERASSAAMDNISAMANVETAGHHRHCCNERFLCSSVGTMVVSTRTHLSTSYNNIHKRTFLDCGDFRQMVASFYSLFLPKFLVFSSHWDSSFVKRRILCGLT